MTRAGREMLLMLSGTTGDRLERMFAMEDIRQIFYDEKNDFYVDDLGVVIDNIYRVVDPNMIYLLRTKKDDMFVYGIHGEYIELIYEGNHMDYL